MYYYTVKKLLTLVVMWFCSCSADPKYITQATAHMGYTTPIMWEYINKGDQKNTKELFKAIISTTETETKKKSVQEARRYILSNWKGIRNQYELDYAGCSAEGHVSHILHD